MKKRLFATLLACVMTVSLVACGGSSEKKEDTSDSKKQESNKIAARWPAKAVAQFSTFSKKGSDRIVPR